MSDMRTVIRRLVELGRTDLAQVAASCEAEIDRLRAELAEARRLLDEERARVERLRDDVHYAWTTERECRGRLASIEAVCRKLVARRNNDDGYTVLTVDLQTLDELLALPATEEA